MKAIELVHRAINHEETDQIPAGEIRINQQLGLAILGSKGPITPKKLESLLGLLEMDLVSLHVPDLVEHDRKLQFNKQAFSKEIGSFVQGDQYFIFVVISGPWSFLSKKIGTTELLRRIYTDRQSVTDYFKAIAKELQKLIRYLEDKGAHGIMLADDIAYNEGLFAPVNVLKELLFPWYVEIREHHTGPLFFHSDGRTMEIIPQIIAAGFNGLHPIDRNAGMSLREVKKKYGNKLCLMGSLNPNILFTGNEEDIIHSVAEALTIGGAGGGYVFGTSSGLSSGMDPLKIHRAFRWANWYRLDQMKIPRT